MVQNDFSEETLWRASVSTLFPHANHKFFGFWNEIAMSEGRTSYTEKLAYKRWVENALWNVTAFMRHSDDVKRECISFIIQFVNENVIDDGDVQIQKVSVFTWMFDFEVKFFGIDILEHSTKFPTVVDGNQRALAGVPPRTPMDCWKYYILFFVRVSTVLNALDTEWIYR